MKTPMTSESILRALQVGASTADELACDLAGGSRLASAILHNLRKQGRVKARPYTYGGGPKTLLYSLPEHGL